MRFRLPNAKPPLTQELTRAQSGSHYPLRHSPLQLSSESSITSFPLLTAIMSIERHEYSEINDLLKSLRRSRLLNSRGVIVR